VRSEEGSQAEREKCLTEEVIKASEKSGGFGTTTTDGGACRSHELTEPRVVYILTCYTSFFFTFKYKQYLHWKSRQSLAQSCPPKMSSQAKPFSVSGKTAIITGAGSGQYINRS
jgi:hypothetical protein